ncbi:putative phosphoglycerate mutase (2,3-diphosphoglycerate-independent) [Helianthus annuus]|nr:putative phosphoglycerate mutase (2,3-diphosphoglycerate-independent) [Helianthus annuus]KAJ0566902.1 putative phosphoglycerate mutase (2,3-diphosphoglycerate-independent) [Helianthus annuus]KAJ0573566.1 putative phosphoglycerate mutase (2,3-diphosphoglycerate-independent) [Helianthus annuus]KAJ0737928.1 putative phosphoglycerate mutase (2,3-diphosphoglycerate-independent) [Helianthus annuus]KAJ0740813.1 putative phosphoglycerate mutase (2,3-diphosphoglycerate-independent) [Helianthus annuus
MSGVDVHSRLDQLQLLLKGASEHDAKRIRVHVLTDGRDVVDGSSVGFAETLEKVLAELRGKGIDAQVASGNVLLEFIVAVVWQLVEAALGDEGLLELTKERTHKWNVPQDMEIEKRNKILQGRNTVMAVELIGLFLQNQITSRILLLARRNMPTHWRSLVQDIEVLAVNSSALRNSKLLTGLACSKYTASFQDFEPTAQQFSSDTNKSHTGSTLADQNLDDTDIKYSNHGLVIEPLATVPTSVAKARRADTKNACGSDINAVLKQEGSYLVLLLHRLLVRNLFRSENPTSYLVHDFVICDFFSSIS